MLRKPEDIIIHGESLDVILEDHLKWLYVRCKLEDANMCTFHEYDGVEARRACGVMGADLSYADLKGLDLSEIDMSFTNLKGSDLSGAHLNYTNLSFSNLEGTDFTNAHMKGVNLTGAKCKNANFTNVDLRLSEWDGDCKNKDLLLDCSVTGDSEEMHGAYLCHVKLRDKSLLCVSDQVKLDEDLALRTLVHLMKCIKVSALPELQKELFTPELTARYKTVLDHEVEERMRKKNAEKT